MISRKQARKERGREAARDREKEDHGKLAAETDTSFPFVT